MWARQLSRSSTNRSSVAPCLDISGLRGTQKPPEDLRVVPPTAGAASSTATDMPASAATVAAVSPAAPLPTTTTSHAICASLFDSTSISMHQSYHCKIYRNSDHPADGRGEAPTMDFDNSFNVTA